MNEAQKLLVAIKYGRNIMAYFDRVKGLTREEWMARKKQFKASHKGSWKAARKAIKRAITATSTCGVVQQGE